MILAVTFVGLFGLAFLAPLPARVEALNKQYDSEILVTRSVIEGLTEEEQASAIPVGRVTVKGRTEPVEIYRLA